MDLLLNNALYLGLPVILYWNWNVYKRGEMYWLV